MALTPGSRLGPYELSTSIGVGGMGEVFRARDTKLHRAVAIGWVPASGENAGNDAFLAMEMVAGRPLSEVIRGMKR